MKHNPESLSQVTARYFAREASVSEVTAAAERQVMEARAAFLAEQQRALMLKSREAMTHFVSQVIQLFSK